MNAWLSVASAFLATVFTDVTRYLSRCESARNVTVSPFLILSSRAKNPIPSVAESTCPAIRSCHDQHLQLQAVPLYRRPRIQPPPAHRLGVAQDSADIEAHRHYD